MEDISRETITKAAEGDRAAFEEVYKKTSSLVYNVAFRVAANKQDAEEIAQDVFVTVFRKLASYRFESSFKTWIYRVTVNHALNFMKKYSKQRNRTIPYDDTFQEDALEKKEPEVLHLDAEETVDKLLQTLNPEQRTCVVLRNMEGLSYREIAESLKININTVRSRLKRAREALLKTRKGVLAHEV